MRKRSNKEIQLTTYDDLLGISNEESVDTEKIKIVPLNDLYDFKDHPFRVVDDEKMEETTESIKKYGVLVPGIARPRAGGGYEIIAGHRRKRGSERAGKSEMPVIVRNYTDDEATIIMVDSNIQREDILPSEKAKAYFMKYEEIAQKITVDMDRGVTLLEGEGGYTHNSTKVVLTAIKRQQLAELKKLVAEVDSKAFVIVQEAHQVLGDGFSHYSKDSI